MTKPTIIMIMITFVTQENHLTVITGTQGVSARRYPFSILWCIPCLSSLYPLGYPLSLQSVSSGVSPVYQVCILWRILCLCSLYPLMYPCLSSLYPLVYPLPIQSVSSGVSFLSSLYHLVYPFYPVCILWCIPFYPVCIL